MSLWGVQEDFRVEVVVKPGLEGRLSGLDGETEEQHSERGEQHTQRFGGRKTCCVRVPSKSREPQGATQGLGR